MKKEADKPIILSPELSEAFQTIENNIRQAEEGRKQVGLQMLERRADKLTTEFSLLLTKDSDKNSVSNELVPLSAYISPRAVHPNNQKMKGFKAQTKKKPLGFL